MKNRSQCEFAIQSIQIVFFAIFYSSSMRQFIFFVLIFAINQNRSINKNSKSSNSKSLKQHTFAKSISFCSFYFVRKIDRFIILICRCFLHRSTKFSTRFSFSLSSHIFIFIFLFSHVSYFRIYFFTFIAFVLRFSAFSIINQLFTFQSINFFAMSIDKKKMK